jgi:hypothetical protein
MFHIKRFQKLNEAALVFEQLPLNPKCPICGAMSDKQPENSDNYLCVKREHSEPGDVYEPAVAHYICRGKPIKKENEVEDDTYISNKKIHDFYLSYEPK